MAVLVDVKVKGNTVPLQNKILIAKTATTKASIKRMASTIPKATSRNLNSLYSNISKAQGVDPAAEADVDIVDVGSVFIKRRGKQVGTVKGDHRSAAGVLGAFTSGKDNLILLSFPVIDKGRALAIKPTPKELVAKKDGRTANTWNIGLTDAAVTKYRNELELAVHMSTVEQLGKVMSGVQANGVTMKIAARLGVSADSITMVGTSGNVVGTNLTTLVQNEVARRMSKTGKAEEILNYRSGGFVQGISAKVSTRNLITYTYDKERYGVHEKAKGTITKINAAPGKVLAFTNKKTGDKVFTKSISIPARPVIRESIRAVALKLFNKKFKLGLR